MPITKPYKRLHRPMLNGASDEYLTDTLYAGDRLSLIHSYHLIEKDIKVLFDYISPNDLNKKTFSHRIYELFLRSCTEVENNASNILAINGYVSTRRYQDMNDYFKLNTGLRLSDYEVRLNVWENNPLQLRPFQSWNTATFTALPWYTDYNSVKHDRTNNFHLANLENLLNSIAGLLAILYAQFAHHIFSPYRPVQMINNHDGFESMDDNLFEIKPLVWQTADKYDFDWNALKTTAVPLNSYSF